MTSAFGESACLQGSGVKKTTSRESVTAAVEPVGGAGIRRGLSAGAIAQALIDNLHCLQAMQPQRATPNDWNMALAYTARDRTWSRYITTLGCDYRLRTVTRRWWPTSQPNISPGRSWATT